MTGDSWRFNDARDAIASLHLDGPNLLVADYWLSLWRGDRAPQFGSFDARRLPGFLPALAIFAVTPDTGFHCLMAGNYVRLATGVDMAGKDFRAWTADEHRDARLKTMTRLAQGEVWCAKREFLRGPNLRKEQIGELALPFAGAAEDGTRRVLFHTNWRPKSDENIMSAVPRAEVLPPGITTSVALARPQRLSAA